MDDVFTTTYYLEVGQVQGINVFQYGLAITDVIPKSVLGHAVIGNETKLFARDFRVGDRVVYDQSHEHAVRDFFNQHTEKI